jgi:4-hydroxyphenylpyruvate dioxygenase-like putative hemolysin
MAMNTDELAADLNLGQVAQIGCVVRELTTTIRNYEKVLGIGPFNTIDFRPEKSFIKGRSPEIYLKIGITQLTPALSLELIEVVKGEPYHRDFLESHGEGVQHLGFLTDEYDQVLERAGKMGIEVLMWAETEVPGMGQVRGAYLDTHALIGTLVEIIEVKSP